MQKSLSGKRSIVNVLLSLITCNLVVCSLVSCSPIRENSLIEVENEEEQYKEMEKELRDLKTIKVKCLPPERFKEMQKKIYENYFRYKDDIEHLRKKGNDGYHAMIYETEGIYQCLDWGDDFVCYYGRLFGAGYIYETTKGQVIQKETEKLFKLLGLEYGDEEDGYVIDKMVVQGNNSIEVYVKKNIGGKELSLSASMTAETCDVEDICITFGSNKIIGIELLRLSEVVEIKDYEEEVFVDDPQKACKLLNNFLDTWGFERKTMDTVRIAYATSSEENGIYTLRPMAEFYLKPDINAEIGKVFRVDLTTKDVGSTEYGSYCENA